MTTYLGNAFEDNSLKACFLKSCGTDCTCNNQNGGCTEKGDPCVKGDPCTKADNPCAAKDSCGNYHPCEEYKRCEIKNCPPQATEQGYESWF